MCPPAGSEETDVSPGCGGQSADITWQETSIETQLRASSSTAMKLERRRRWYTHARDTIVPTSADAQWCLSRDMTCQCRLNIRATSGISKRNPSSRRPILLSPPEWSILSVRVWLPSNYTMSDDEVTNRKNYYSIYYIIYLHYIYVYIYLFIYFYILYILLMQRNFNDSDKFFIIFVFIFLLF